MKKFDGFLNEQYWDWFKKNVVGEDPPPERDRFKPPIKPIPPKVSGFGSFKKEKIDFSKCPIKVDDYVKVTSWNDLSEKQITFLKGKPYHKVLDVTVKDGDPYIGLGYNIPFKMARFEIIDFKNYKHKILFLQFNIGINLHGEPDPGDFFKGKATMPELFTEIFNEKMPDAFVNFAEYSDIYKTSGGYFIDDINIKDYNFVFFGFMSNYSAIARLIIEYLERNNVPYLKYETYKDFDNKAYEFDLVEKLGYPYIPSIMVSKLNRRVIEEVKKFDFPVVVKDVTMARGEGVHKIDSLKDLEQHFTRNYGNRLMLIQKFIANDGDYRVIVIKHKKVLIIKRQRIKEEEFRSNVALGGKAVKAELPKEIIEMCEDISKHVFCDIVGFDILKDLKTGDFYVMETNASPHFPTFSVVSGINMPAFISDYIIHQIKKNEKKEK